MKKKKRYNSTLIQSLYLLSKLLRFDKTSTLSESDFSKKERKGRKSSFFKTKSEKGKCDATKEKRKSRHGVCVLVVRKDSCFKHMLNKINNSVMICESSIQTLSPVDSNQFRPRNYKPTFWGRFLVYVKYTKIAAFFLFWDPVYLEKKSTFSFWGKRKKKIKCIPTIRTFFNGPREGNFWKHDM